MAPTRLSRIIGPMKLLEAVKQAVRKVMERLAGVLHRLSGGKLTPDMVTLFGFFAHLLVAWQIITGNLPLAGMLLIVFGLLDTLDGSLARLQGTSRPFGMFLDSMTDRLKEVLLYCSLVAYFVDRQAFAPAVFAATALGVSICISYANAWGEVVMHQAGIKHQTNKSLRGGIMGFEIRMFTLVVGLLASRPDVSVVIIVLLGVHTLASRIVQILRKVS